MSTGAHRTLGYWKRTREKNFKFQSDQHKINHDMRDLSMRNKTYNLAMFSGLIETAALEKAGQAFESFREMQLAAMARV